MHIAKSWLESQVTVPSFKFISFVLIYPSKLVTPQALKVLAIPIISMRASTPQKVTPKFIPGAYTNSLQE
jgi:hypothetical protein